MKELKQQIKEETNCSFVKDNEKQKLLDKADELIEKAEQLKKQAEKL